jgi:hypothetical protein
MLFSASGTAGTWTMVSDVVVGCGVGVSGSSGENGGLDFATKRTTGSEREAASDVYICVGLPSEWFTARGTLFCWESEWLADGILRVRLCGSRRRCQLRTRRWRSDCIRVPPTNYPAHAATQSPVSSLPWYRGHVKSANSLKS